MSCQLSWGREGLVGVEGNFPKTQQQRGARGLVFTPGVLPGVASGQAGPLCGPNYLAQKRCHDCETGQEHIRDEVRVGRRGLSRGRQGPVMVWQTDSERPHPRSLQKLLVLPPPPKPQQLRPPSRAASLTPKLKTSRANIYCRADSVSPLGDVQRLKGPRGTPQGSMPKSASPLP